MTIFRFIQQMIIYILTSALIKGKSLIFKIYILVFNAYDIEGSSMNLRRVLNSR